MSQSLSLSHSLILLGAWNFSVLAIGAVAGLRKMRGAAWPLGFFAALATGIVAVVVIHQGEGVVERSAWALTAAFFLLGPALYAGIRSFAGSALSRKAIFAHLSVAGALPLLAAGTGANSVLLIFQGAAYTAASLRACGKIEGGGTGIVFQAMIGTMLVLIAAQAARLANPSGVPCDLPTLAVALASAGLVCLWVFAGPRSFFPATRYARSGMEDERLREIWVRIQAVLEREHVYRRPNLKLAELADAAGVTPQQASQAISQAGKTSFRELMTRARIEDAKRRLIAPDNEGVAVEPIGMEAGFHSRSAFYRAFVRATGLTPAKYRIRGR